MAAHLPLLQEVHVLHIRTGQGLRDGQGDQTGFSRSLSGDHFPQDPVGQGRVGTGGKSRDPQVVDADDVGYARAGRGDLFGEAGQRRQVAALPSEEPGDPKAVESPPIGLLHKLPGQIAGIVQGPAVEFAGKGSGDFLLEPPGQGHDLHRFPDQPPGQRRGAAEAEE
jgi:hypothetical protein